MITPEQLEILRCPIDPKRVTKLSADDAKLICSQCKVQFRIREGFPSLLVEEATMPSWCSNPDRLPCQKK